VLLIHGLTAVFLVEIRGEMFFLPAVTSVLLQHRAMVTWTECSVLSLYKRKIVVLPAFTAVLLDHCFMNTWPHCSVFIRD